MAAAAAAGTSLFRSMASKMARALPPHRVIAARGIHGGTSSGVGRSSPNPRRLSTSGGSSATDEDLAARNQEILRQAREHVADPRFMQGTMAQLKEANNTCLTILVLGAGLFYTFVNPRFKRLEDRAATLSWEALKLKYELRNIKDEGHKAKLYETQSMETSGTRST